MTNDDLVARFTAEADALAQQPAFTLQIRPIEAWMILAQLQIAFRHPKNTGPTRDVAIAFARQIEAHIATTPALKEIARRGWDPTYDE